MDNREPQNVRIVNKMMRALDNSFFDDPGIAALLIVCVLSVLGIFAGGFYAEWRSRENEKLWNAPRVPAVEQYRPQSDGGVNLQWLEPRVPSTPAP